MIFECILRIIRTKNKNFLIHGILFQQSMILLQSKFFYINIDSFKQLAVQLKSSLKKKHLYSLSLSPCAGTARVSSSGEAEEALPNPHADRCL